MLKRLLIFLCCCFILTLPTQANQRDAQVKVMVSVPDSVAPKIIRVVADPRKLWPPNHKMEKVQIEARIRDNSHSGVTWRIIGVSSDEQLSGCEKHDETPDWQITGDHTLKLRAERCPKGNGRTYTVTIQARDSNNNRSTAEVNVFVPKDRKPHRHHGRKDDCFDDHDDDNHGRDHDRDWDDWRDHDRDRDDRDGRGRDHDRDRDRDDRDKNRR